MQEMITPEEFAAAKKISLTSVYRYAKANRLSPTPEKIGRMIRLFPETIVLPVAALSSKPSKKMKPANTQAARPKQGVTLPPSKGWHWETGA